MDHNAIDQIMSAVNGMGMDDDMSFFTRALPHRSPLPARSTTPSTQPVLQGSINGNGRSDINKPRISHPVDPVKSVSSAENVSPCSAEFDEVPKTKSISTKQNRPQMLSNRLDKLAARNVAPPPTDGTNSDPDQIVDDVTDTAGAETGGIIVGQSHLTFIMGYSIPTSTLYFIIVVVIIAVALYFLTGERKKPVKQDPEKGKKHDHDHDHDD